MSSVTEIVAIGITGCAWPGRSTASVSAMRCTESIAPSGDQSRSASRSSATSSTTNAPSSESACTGRAAIAARSASMAATSLRTAERETSSTCFCSR